MVLGIERIESAVAWFEYRGGGWGVSILHVDYKKW